MKYHMCRVQIVLVAIALFSVTGPAAAADAVPFKGDLEGSYTVTPVPPFPPQFFDVLVTAEGEATHLGRFTVVFPATVDVSTVPSTAVGTYTFTAANGDTLVADSIGEAVVVAPGLLYIVDEATIVGGTGRLAGASGQFVVERLADQMTLTTVGSFEGTLCCFGDDGE